MLENNLAPPLVKGSMTLFVEADSCAMYANEIPGRIEEIHEMVNGTFD